MNRVHKWTLLCFLFAAFFVLGSMAGMDFILQKRENRLLQESGSEETEPPVAVWREPQADEAGRPDVSFEEKARQLTVEQMEEVINYRDSATDEVLHDPVSGQISMEEAIACGEQWLVEMGFLEEEHTGSKNAGSGQTGITAGENNGQILCRRASLGIKKERRNSQVPMEPYYSFWTVRFSGGTVNAVLSVNAVTGSVWDAEITLYNDMTRKFSWETLDLFTKLAGVQAEFENYVDINKTNTGATLAVKDSYLRAQVEYYDIVVAVGNGEDWNAGSDEEDQSMARDDIRVTEYYGGREMHRRRIIEYHLILPVAFSSSS